MFRFIPTAALAVLLGYASLSSLLSAASARPSAVGSIGFEELCGKLQSGERVVFVDVREPAEFAEEHLPRATLLPARDMAALAPDQLPFNATLIPYCLKDFRGFEAAKRLRRLGYPDVRLLEGVGLSGWKAHGLPTVGAHATHNGAEAWQALLDACGRRK